nr:FAD-binding oxidoreductase [uncultured Rhodopila sp.]
MVLLCQTFPRSPLHLKLPYTYDRISFGQIRQEWAADIAVCDKVSSNVVRLVLRTLDARSGAPVAMPFFPGQFVDIEVPGQHATRSYSMATIPGSAELEFFIRILPGGLFSEYLTRRADIGQRLTLRGPSGAFGLHENGLRPRFFVAGGTGLSPVLSMVRHMGQERHPQPAALLFGVTHEHELFYHKELLSLAKDMPNLSVHISIMQPTDSWSGQRGTVVDALREQLDVANIAPDIYLCGPPGMIEATMAVGSARGIPENQIYSEKFLPSG